MRVEASTGPTSSAAPAPTDAQRFAEILGNALREHAGKSGEFRVAGGNETWPPVRGTEVVGLPERYMAEHPELAGEALAFRSGGETTVVRRADNPGLYAYAEALSAIPDVQRDVIKGEGAEVLRGGDTLPLEKISTWVSYEGGALWKLGLSDGREVMVQRELTPELADKVGATVKGWDDGFAMVDGGRQISKEALAGAKVLAPNEEQGFIGIEVDGQHLHISRDVNPGLYDRAAAQYGEAHAGEAAKAVDDARREGKMPGSGELDLGALKTSETDSKDKDRKLTVNELTWQNLVKNWKSGIEKGDIPASDERAQLYRAIQAKGASEDGLNMVGLDMASGQSLNHATGKDFGTIVDAEKVDARIPELMGSDAVGKDLAAERKASLGKAEGGEEAMRRLEQMAFGTDYMKYLGELRAAGKGEVAKDDIASTFDALLVMDPQKAAGFAQSAQVDALTMDLDALMANPDQVSAENLTTATQDTGKVILQVIKKLGIDAGRRLVESEKFLKEVLQDKVTAKNFGNAMQELGALYSKNGQVTTDDIQRLMGSGGKYQSVGEAAGGGGLKAISEMNANGMLGSAGGLVSLASGIYQLTGKGGTLADTPEERLGIAKEFISFIGAGRHFVNLGTRMTDSINGTKTNELLGLDKSLPDLFGKRSETIGGGLTATPEVLEEFTRNVNAEIDGSSDPKRAAGYFRGIEGADTQKLIDGMANGFQKRPDLPEGMSGWKRGASAVLQVLDAGANSFVGIADSVIGGLTIRNGLSSGSDETVAKGALQVASGAFGTAAGVFSFAGLGGLNAIKAAAAPSFFISAILSAATLIPDIILDEKNRKAMDAHREELQTLFTGLSEDGLLRQDGLDLYRYLDASMYTFGQRDAPDDKGIFEFRAEEVAKWLTAWREGEWGDNTFTSDVVFEEVGHEDYKGDGENIWTDLEDTSAS
ncbi:hypothetical protein [Roseomonas sp. WA12]